jgi:hypothetical protein
VNDDTEHLRLLTVFHYVVGGVTALFALLPVFHLIVGIFVVRSAGTFAAQGGPPPAIFGWFFIICAAAIIALGWLLAACMILAGRFLARRRHYLFCLVVAVSECLFLPLGTVLGVFTIIVLLRDSVKRLFPQDVGAQSPP